MTPQDHTERNITHRRAVMRYLAAASAARMTAAAVGDHLEMSGYRLSAEELETHLDFLTRDGWLEFHKATAASRPRWQATPKLILAAENREF